MAGVVAAKENNIKPIGQASRMECWLACYTMLLQQNDPNLTTAGVEAKLTSGGFSSVTDCKANGLDDSQFPAAAAALGLETSLPGCLLSPAGVRTRLITHGALWLAAQLESDGKRWKHIIILMGLDEERNQLYIVNPWKQSLWDTPSKAWVDWKWVRDGIFYGSESVTAGCQYLKA